jgi:hypothetical protein
MGFLSRLFGPRPTEPLLSVLPEITRSIENDGSADLTLALTSYQRLDDGTQVCEARGLHEGREVGFRVRLSPTWKEGTLGDSIVTYQSSLEVESLGRVSDDFLAALSALYGEPAPPKRMAASTRFTAISLQGTPAQLEAGMTKIKLFFEPQDESEEAHERLYVEHYLNIDTASAQVGFLEKDNAYRDAMLRVLAGKK